MRKDQNFILFIQYRSGSIGSNCASTTSTTTTSSIQYIVLAADRKMMATEKRHIFCYDDTFGGCGCNSLLEFSSCHQPKWRNDIQMIVCL